MGIHFKHFNDVARVALDKVAAEFAHLQDEIAGRDTGKRHKHLVSADYTADSVENGGKGNKRGLTALDIILMQSSYDESYKAVMEALASAEIETETAIEAALQAHEEAKAAYADIQSRAATLPDGTRVYRDEDTGLFYTDDDTLVDPETAARIEWNTHNATRQENLAAREQVKDTADHLNAWYGYQIKLGEFRNEMENDPSRERMDEIMQGIEDSRPENMTTEAALDNTKPGITDEATISTSVPVLELSSALNN